GRQALSGLDRGAPSRDSAGVRRPGRDVPATRATVVAVGRGAEPEVGATGPVGRVVPRSPLVPTGVGHLVEMIAVRRKPYVCQQILVRVAVVFRRRDGPARDPAGEG